MKSLIVLLSALFSLTAFANVGTLQEERELIVGVSDALVPSKAKANESIKAVVSGMFPNGCYRYNRSEVEHDSANNIHEVKTYASVSQGMCLMVLVPFTKEVMLGKLDKGEHRIRFINGDGTYMEKRIIAE